MKMSFGQLLFSAIVSKLLLSAPVTQPNPVWHILRNFVNQSETNDKMS